MLYDYDKNLKELKTRGMGAIMGKTKATPSVWGFVNAKGLIDCVEHGQPIKVMDMEGVEPENVIFSYDFTSTVIAEYPTIEDLLNDGWRLD